MLPTPNPPPPARVKRLEYVDALRGVAILLVVLVHAGQALTQPGLFATLARYGQYGVQLFFVLSAFTLCHSLAKHDHLTASVYRSFMIRRFFRIAPMYYLAIPFYFLLSWVSFWALHQSPFTPPDEYSLFKILCNVGFVHGLIPAATNSIVPGGWSIGCEFLFYAFFPFLFFGVRRQKAVLVYTTALAVLLVFAIITWSSPSVAAATQDSFNNTFVYYHICNQYVCFALGIAYFFYSDRRFSRPLVLVTGIIAALLLGPCFDWRWGALLTPLLTAYIAVTLLITVRGWDLNGLLIKTGERSFSIYLCHFVPAWGFRYFFRKVIPPEWQSDWIGAAGFVAILALSYFAASLTTRLIEAPFIQRGHRMTSQ